MLFFHFCLYSQNNLQYLNESYRITFFHQLLASLICYPLVSLTHTLCFSKRNPAKVSSQLAIHPQEESEICGQPELPLLNQVTCWKACNKKHETVYSIMNIYTTLPLKPKYEKYRRRCLIPSFITNCTRILT